MKALLVLSVPLLVFALPTCGLWLLGRRAKVPAWMMTVFLAAGWLTVLVGGFLSQRAQPALFPETSPCHGAGTPVSRYLPPDSFCRHDDGELRTVNGPSGKLVFWLALGVAVSVPGVALVRRRVEPGRRPRPARLANLHGWPPT
ncbi:hypothetical protein OG746_22675 [Streptomyces sp. NBC_01016]|uniref:hypothetical protein n=1 Tax=Streptomyces sp. NBC_01016 TaxID=2903720 RepID=UPI00225B0428|nr:hypothetical protein [Streptomyces sp. NBC_01016]MCX4831545.1 hypothetical protein [Streptomyces sp. NBC_01016]